MTAATDFRTTYSRHMDFGDAARTAWRWLRELQEGPHPAPGATQIRDLSGRFGTGPSSGDHTMTLWVNSRPFAICNLFRDDSNFTILMRTRLEAGAAEATADNPVDELARRIIRKQVTTLNADQMYALAASVLHTTAAAEVPECPLRAEPHPSGPCADPNCILR